MLNKNAKDKRGAELSVNVIIIVILALVVLVVLVAVFTKNMIGANNQTSSLMKNCPGGKQPVTDASSCGGTAIPHGTDGHGHTLYCCGNTMLQTK